jgi:hypothetical protein
MIARIRVVVEVPFDYTVDPPDAEGNSANKAGAGEDAHDNVMPLVKNAVSDLGTVMDDLCLVEEVREG